MKKIILVVILAATSVFSCSSDKEDDSNFDSNSLIGVWKFSNIDADGATGNIKLSNDILNVLVNSGCDILTYNFKTDQTVNASFRDFTETGNSVNASGTGLLIECPTNVVTSTSVWELEGDQLSFINANGAIETITIKIDGDTLTVPGEVINQDNLANTKAIFVRE
tara:strand:- start:50 stop:547 length:498 start_codon:yes stop_codon:yes gene_type:complete